jgi:transposase-like protein
MARPTKTADKKRSYPIKSRVTEAEKKRIDQLALEHGISVSDLIKLQVLGTEPKRRKASPERAALIRASANLGRIAGNINQIAKKLNSGPAGAFDLSPDEISDALYEIKLFSKRIAQELENGH